MSGTIQAQPKVATSSSAREADWHPAQMRSFAAPTTAVPPQEAKRPDLVGAYLQRRRIASSLDGLTSRGEEAVAGPAVQRAPTEGGAPSAEAHSQPAENRTGMPDRLKTGLEQISGHDLSAVNVHYNSAKPAQLNALAYTQGTDIHVGPGQESSLPHEGWHVVQQMQGRVRPTMALRGVAINDDKALESEADTMGTRALQMRPQGVSKAGAVQRAELFAHELTHVVQQNGGRGSPAGTVVTQIEKPKKDMFDAYSQKQAAHSDATLGSVHQRQSRKSEGQVTGAMTPASAVGEFSTVATGKQVVQRDGEGSFATKLTPRDNFGGRSLTNFGVGEVIDLSVTYDLDVVDPPQAVGGLAWTTNNGTISAEDTDAATATFTADGGPGEATLDLRGVGAYMGIRIGSTPIQIVAPAATSSMVSERAESKGPPTEDYVQALFDGRMFYEPKNVSFKWMEVKEGFAIGEGTGYWHGYQNLHKPGEWDATSGGDSGTGSHDIALDEIQTAQAKSPFSDGTFIWKIPWSYRVGGAGAGTVFKIAVHEEKIDGEGTIKIRKAGSGWQPPG